MKFKIRLDWKKAAIFLSVSAGLLYLTRSALMSIGIMMLLFVDALIVNYEYRQQTRRFFEELQRENTDEATNEDENEQR